MTLEIITLSNKRDASAHNTFLLVRGQTVLARAVWYPNMQTYLVTDKRTGATQEARTPLGAMAILEEIRA